VGPEDHLLQKRPDNHDRRKALSDDDLPWSGLMPQALTGG